MFASEYVPFYGLQCTMFYSSIAFVGSHVSAHCLGLILHSDSCDLT
jgi:hypothetical protein